MSENNQISTPEQAEFRSAALLLMGALPVGAEMHFYWEGGTQHMKVTLANAAPIVYALHRKVDGSGFVSTVLN